jgi:hypothetical protein
MSSGLRNAKVALGDCRRCCVSQYRSSRGGRLRVRLIKCSNAALALVHQGEALAPSATVARPCGVVRASDGGSRGKRGEARSPGDRPDSFSEEARRVQSDPNWSRCVIWSARRYCDASALTTTFDISSPNALAANVIARRYFVERAGRGEGDRVIGQDR